MTSPAMAASDTWVMAKRNLTIWTRVPVFIVFSLVQPVIFTLLFRYVFGGAIPVALRGGYVEYLLPGVIGQTAAFASMGTAISLSTEVKEGVVDRLRAMPIARSAYLNGRILADVLRMTMTVLVIVGNSDSHASLFLPILIEGDACRDTRRPADRAMPFGAGRRSLRVGVDFDNTVVCYDGVFRTVGVKGNPHAGPDPERECLRRALGAYGSRRLPRPPPHFRPPASPTCALHLPPPLQRAQATSRALTRPSERARPDAAGSA